MNKIDTVQPHQQPNYAGLGMVSEVAYPLPQPADHSPEAEKLLGDGFGEPRKDICGCGEERVVKYGPLWISLCALAVVAAVAMASWMLFQRNHNPIAREVPPVTFVTAETRGDPLLMRADRVRVGANSSRFPLPIVNVGIGRKWHNFKTKVVLFAEYLHSKIAKGEGDDVVVFLDGSDTIWGGCPMEDFVSAYRRIVQASGAEIVFSAELACAEQFCKKVPPIPQWANELAGDKELQNGFWKPYAKRCIPHGKEPFSYFSPPCYQTRQCAVFASWSCDMPPAVKFLNSGFVMGPVAKLAPMADWVVENYKKWSMYGDQGVFGIYWLNNTKDVALDYLGELSLSLSNFGDENHDLLHVDRIKGTIEMLPFHRTQCIMHGNGIGIKLMKNLLKEISTGDVPVLDLKKVDI
jgi:hypothetical protein